MAERAPAQTGMSESCTGAATPGLSIVRTVVEAHHA